MKNPLFLDCVRAEECNGKLLLDLGAIRDCMGLVPQGEKVYCGLMLGFFHNEGEIRQSLGTKSVGEVFEELKGDVKKFYGVQDESPKV